MLGCGVSEFVCTLLFSYTPLILPELSPSDFQSLKLRGLIVPVPVPRAGLTSVGLWTPHSSGTSTFVASVPLVCCCTKCVGPDETAPLPPLTILMRLFLISSVVEELLCYSSGCFQRELVVVDVVAVLVCLWVEVSSVSSCSTILIQESLVMTVEHLKCG